MYLSVKSVKPLDGYKLLLKFENDEEKVFDVSPYLDLGKFSELKNVSLFNSVTVSFDTIKWSNHQRPHRPGVESCKSAIESCPCPPRFIPKCAAPRHYLRRES